MKIDSIDTATNGLKLALSILEDKTTDYSSIDDIKVDFVEKIKEAEMKN
jgi:hypothetical protein